MRVPDSIQTGNGTRLGFRGWSDAKTQNDPTVTFGNNLTLSVDYGEQYELGTASPYGSLGGPGRYFEGQAAEPTCSVPTDGSRAVIAVWRDDYAIPFLLSLAVIGAVVI